MNRLRTAALAAVAGLGVACGCSGPGVTIGNGSLMSRIRGHRDCPAELCGPACPGCGDGPSVEEGAPFPVAPGAAGINPSAPPPPGTFVPGPMPRVVPVPADATPVPAPPGTGVSRTK